MIEYNYWGWGLAVWPLMHGMRACETTGIEAEAPTGLGEPSITSAENENRTFVFHPLPAPDRVCGSSGALSGSAIP